MFANTKQRGTETHSYRLGFSDGLSATAVWVKAIDCPMNAPITVMLNDGGIKDLREQVSDRVNRGDQVLAIDLLFTGGAAPHTPMPADYALLFASVGDRPLGIEVAQLIAATEWLRNASGAKRARLETYGIRSQLTSLIGAALAPQLFSEALIRNGMRSLRYLLETPVLYRAAPDLFCLDLLKEFDIGTIASLAAPTKVTQEYVGRSN